MITVPTCNTNNCGKLITTVCRTCYSNNMNALYCPDHCDSTNLICDNCFDISFQYLLIKYDIENVMKFKPVRALHTEKRQLLAKYLYSFKESFSAYKPFRFRDIIEIISK